jgi:hypothetical protein
MIIEEIISLNGAYSQKRNGFFVFRLTPHDSSLTVKRVRVDEISESEK